MKALSQDVMKLSRLQASVLLARMPVDGDHYTLQT